MLIKIFIFCWERFFNIIVADRESQLFINYTDLSVFEIPRLVTSLNATSQAVSRLEFSRDTSEIYPQNVFSESV